MPPTRPILRFPRLCLSVLLGVASTGPALAAAPTVPWSATAPNPTLVAVDVPTMTRNITYNRHIPKPWDKTNTFKKCGDIAFDQKWMTDAPVLTIDIAPGTPRLDLDSSDLNFIVVKPDERYYCVKERSLAVKNPPPGTWKVFATQRTKKGATSGPGSDQQVFRIYHWSAPARIGADMAKRTASASRTDNAPVRFDGTLRADKRLDGPTCAKKGVRFSARPDALVTTDGPLDVWLHSKSANRRVWTTRIKQGRIKWPNCRNASTDHITIGDKGPSTWAIWVATPRDEAGRPFSLVLTHRKMTNARFIAPRQFRPDGGIEARLLNNVYPYLEKIRMSGVGPSPATVAELWRNVDPRFWAFTAEPVGRAGANEPVLLTRPGRGRFPYAIMFPHGRTSVYESHLAWAPKGPPVFRTKVTSMPDSAASDPDTLKKVTEPQVHKLIDQVFAKRAKYHACFDKTFRKYDNTGTAYRKQLVTKRNGRVVKVENWGSKIAKKADRKCKGKALNKLEKKFDKVVGGSYAKLATARLEAFASKVRARFETKQKQ